MMAPWGAVWGVHGGDSRGGQRRRQWQVDGGSFGGFACVK